MCYFYIMRDVYFEMYVRNIRMNALRTPMVLFMCTDALHIILFTINMYFSENDCLCGLVNRYQIFWKVVGLEYKNTTRLFLRDETP
jgi:hypothetical protein